MLLYNVKLLSENLPLDFTMLHKKNFLTLKIKSKPLKLTEKEGYYFYNGKIYHPDLAQIRIYDIFNTFFEQDKTNTLCFNPEEAENLASFIIPALKGISNGFCIDETLENTFYEAPLKIKTAADLIEQLYTLIARSCHKYYFSSEDPFRSVGIAQTDFLRIVLKLKFKIEEKIYTSGVFAKACLGLLLRGHLELAIL